MSLPMSLPVCSENRPLMPCEFSLFPSCFQRIVPLCPAEGRPLCPRKQFFYLFMFFIQNASSVMVVKQDGAIPEG